MRSVTVKGQSSKLGGRIAALVGSGPAGLLGPVAKVPQQVGYVPGIGTKYTLTSGYIKKSFLKD